MDDAIGYPRLPAAESSRTAFGQWPSGNLTIAASSACAQHRGSAPATPLSGVRDGDGPRRGEDPGFVTPGRGAEDGDP